jgi:hypothetical protein
MLRHKLLQYNYHNTTNYRPIHSFPTVTPPLSTLYDSWGHSLPTIDPSKIIRVFLQNPNGLRLSSTPYALQHDLRLCNEYGAAALCLPETNTNWDLSKTKALFSQALKNTWRNSACIYSKSPEDFISTQQPGGTATVILDNWTSRVIDKGEDPLGLGRWSYVTLQGKADRRLTVVTAYNATISQGDATNFQQQSRVLSRMHREHEQHLIAQPRRQFILDLQGWLSDKIEGGHELIVSMDANDTYNPGLPGTPHPVEYQPERPTISSTHNGKLSTLIASCGLRDPLAMQHSSRPFPASHIRGSKRIDYILVTPSLVPAVTNSGSLAFHSLFHSDHRAYYLDFNSVLLFSAPAYDIAPPSYRQLQLSDPRLKNQYRDILHKQLEYHKIYDKVESLQVASATGTWSDAHTQDYQSVDKTITEAMLHAESNTGRKFSTRYEWSPELKWAVQTFRY